MSSILNATVCRRLPATASHDQIRAVHRSKMVRKHIAAVERQVRRYSSTLTFEPPKPWARSPRVSNANVNRIASNYARGLLNYILVGRV